MQTRIADGRRYGKLNMAELFINRKAQAGVILQRNYYYGITMYGQYNIPSYLICHSMGGEKYLDSNILLSVYTLNRYGDPEVK
jgi:hypothetical protein